MLGKIAESKEFERISIEYLGMIQGDKVTQGEPWAGAHENYDFSEQDGVTTVKVEIDATGDVNMDEMFNGMWPKALAKLKGMCEAN